MFRNKDNHPPEKIYPPGTSKIIRFVIDHSRGLVKDEKEAMCLIIIFVILSFIVSVILFLKSGNLRLPDIQTLPAE